MSNGLFHTWSFWFVKLNAPYTKVSLVGGPATYGYLIGAIRMIDTLASTTLEDPPFHSSRIVHIIDNVQESACGSARPVFCHFCSPIGK